MKRFYMSPIEQVDVPGIGLTWRPKLAAYSGLLFSAIIPTNAQTGAPLFSWALCIAAGSDHTGPTSDATIDTLPDITLDSTLSVLTNQQRTQLFNKMTARGVDITGLGVNSTFREVIERIGHHLDLAFTANAFDAREPA